MSEASKVQDKAQAAPAAPAASGKGKVAVCAVHGDMIHLLTGERITVAGVNVAVDAWVQMQIDAGKLRLDK